ncbi:RHS repeat domain-containing protein, partial [Comamonas composti]|uniref:RHS repeat domain-containing protein n=1 Tax=Comamonas composti TaxID=408558 RepID=UPI001B7FD1BF
AQINKRNAERGYGTTLYAWDGDTLALERDSQSQTDYLYAPGSFTPMVQSKQSADDPQPELAWYQCDHLGTPMELTDAQGKTIWEADYGAFGRARVDAGSRVSSHIRFPGQYHDEETGLHYNRYRYYEPETGRYLSKDPIGLEGGIDQLGYAKGNPIKNVDPIGLETVFVINTNGLGHVGVLVGSGDHAVLYDPGGSFRNEIKGSGDALYGIDASLNDYISYQLNDGPSVETIRFLTTQEEEEEILNNIMNQGGCSPLQCAMCTASAVRGVGPFKDIDFTLFPGSLGRKLNRLKHSPKTSPFFPSDGWGWR